MTTLRPAARASQQPQGQGEGGRGAWLAQVFAAAALALAGLFPVNNPDTFGHLAQGRQIAELGHVPLRDTLSFWQAQPMPWHNYEWLSDLLAFEVYSHVGFDGLLAGKCVLLAGSAMLLTWLARALGGVRATFCCAALIVAAIPAVRVRLTERPHLLALPLSAFYLLAFAYFLRGWGTGSRTVERWLLAALFAAHVLWVNAHGSHLLGVAFTLLFLLFAAGVPGAARKLALVLGLELVASSISPYGPAIVLDAVAHVLDPMYRALVTEWAPWQPTDPLWLLLAPILQTLGLALCAKPLMNRGPCGRALLASACLLALAAFRSIRFGGEYLLLSAPVLGVALGQALRGVQLRRLGPVFAAVLVALSAIVPWAAARMPPHVGMGHGRSNVDLPAASGVWLHEHVRSPRLFAAIEDSWYLMFAVPEARVLVDGRVPFYGPAHISRINLAFASPPHLRILLDHYRVDTVIARITSKAQHVMLTSLLAQPDFSLVTLEDAFSVFLRDGTALVGGGKPQPLRLNPSYELGWLLDANAAAERAIASELGRLPVHENTLGYRGWVEAVLELKPFMRAGRDNGLRSPVGAGEVAIFGRAEARLARAASAAQHVPVVHAYHALVAAALCHFDRAERALSLARAEGESRETLLGAQEVAVRRGDRNAVRAFLARAEALPQARTDPWLSALRDGLRSAPPCP